MSEKDVTFGLFTDPHYAKKPRGNQRHYEEALERVRECLGIFQREQVDFVVCLGDLADHPENPEAAKQELKELAGVIAESGLEFHLVPGNHDVDTMPREALYELCGLAVEPMVSFDRKGIHFVVLDSNFTPNGKPYLPGEVVWDDSYLGKEQLEWLRWDLDAHSGQPAVIFVHANLDAFGEGEALDPHVIRDGNAACCILEAHPCPVTVFQGHYHPGRESEKNGIQYHTLPGIVALETGIYCMTVRVAPEGVQCRKWK